MPDLEPKTKRFTMSEKFFVVDLGCISKCYFIFRDIDFIIYNRYLIVNTIIDTNLENSLQAQCDFLLPI